MVISRGGEQFIREGTCEATVEGMAGETDGRLSLTSERLIFERETGGLFNKSYSTWFEIDLDLVSRVEVVGGFISKSVRVQASWTQRQIRPEYGIYSEAVNVDESGQELASRFHRNYMFKIADAEEWESDIRRAVQAKIADS